MKLDSLRDLFINELRDLYDAEQQIVGALPKMVEGATSPQLKTGFQQHMDQTRGHIERLERIFQWMNTKPGGVKCKGMAGLLGEGQDLFKMKDDPDVMDAGLIGAAQKVEHYEIATYGTVRTWAQMLGESEWANLLQQTLDEEGATDKKLTQLAESFINRQAARAAS